MSSVKFEHRIRPRDVLKWVLGVVGVASIVVLLFVAWNRQLAGKVRERTAELTSSELRYRSVVEDSPGLICRFEPTGTITFVNDAYCIYFGKNGKDLIGTSFFSPISEEDRERVAADIAALTIESPCAGTRTSRYRPRRSDLVA
jgi:PAS domain-containing protein